MFVDGLQLNIAQPLDAVNEDLALQLLIYLRVLGEPCGTRAICGIDQLVGTSVGGAPDVRVATHRCRISDGFQQKLEQEIYDIWQVVSGAVPFFSGMTAEESVARCATLDEQHKAYENNGAGFLAQEDANEQWFRETTRSH
jgi:hypothetical protein